jgi:hypothetical protein
MPHITNPTDIERTPTRATKDMDGWKIFRKAVPEGDLWAITELSKMTGVSVDTIYKWMRPPSTSKKPKATGRRNPFDYVAQVLCALYAVRPDGAEDAFDALDDLRARLRARHGRAPKLQPGQIRSNLRRISREATQMADAIPGGADNEE